MNTKIHNEYLIYSGGIPLQKFKSLFLILVLFIGFLFSRCTTFSAAESIFDLTEEKFYDRDLKDLSESIPYVVGLTLKKTQVTSKGMQYCTKFTELERLSIASTIVDDSGLVPLAKLKKLEELNCDKTQITDRGVTIISQMSSLEHLNLSRNNITDEGLSAITKLSKLNTLILENTKITNKSVNYIRKLKNLEFLLITGTKINKKGIEYLQKKLPECEINNELSLVSRE